MKPLREISGGLRPRGGRILHLLLCQRRRRAVPSALAPLIGPLGPFIADGYGWDSGASALLSLSPMTFGLLVSLAGGAGFLLSGRGLLLKVFCLEVLLLGVAAALAVGLAEAGLAASPVLVAVAAAGAETAVGVSLVVAGHRGAEGRRA